MWKMVIKLWETEMDLYFELGGIAILLYRDKLGHSVHLVLASFSRHSVLLVCALYSQASSNYGSRVTSKRAEHISDSRSSCHLL